MKRRLVLAGVVIGVLIFGVWRPVSGPTSVTETETPLPPTAAAISLTTGEDCPDAPPSRLSSGSEARVVRPRSGQVRRNLVVRDQPAGEQVGLMEPGTRFTISGDSVCDSDGLRWWPVENAEVTGWSVEGFAPDDYLIEPVSN